MKYFTKSRTRTFWNACRVDWKENWKPFVFFGSEWFASAYYAVGSHLHRNDVFSNRVGLHVAGCAF